MTISHRSVSPSSTLSNVEYTQVSFADIQSQISSILDFSTEAFLRNHEITKATFATTASRYRHEFIYLFKEHLADMIEEIERQKGAFFIATNRETNQIIGISMGRPYGKPALSDNFMHTASKAHSNFLAITKDWWRLMEKFQASDHDAPPHPVYHQAVTAVDPQFAGQGVGTELAKLVMKSLPELGFVALARENSSASSDGVMKHLEREGVRILDIASVTNEATTVPVTLRLQLVEESSKAHEVGSWFLEKKETDSVNLKEYSHLMDGTFSLFTNDQARELFSAETQLRLLHAQATKESTRMKLEQKIQELEKVIEKEVNQKDHKGGVPIHGAAHVNDVKTLESLIARNADLYCPEPFYKGTVLHVAVDGNSKDAVRILLQHAPNLVTMPNDMGTTPLAYAEYLQWSKGRGYERIIELLKGAMESQSKTQK